MTEGFFTLNQVSSLFLRLSLNRFTKEYLDSSAVANGTYICYARARTVNINEMTEKHSFLQTENAKDSTKNTKLNGEACTQCIWNTVNKRSYTIN